MTHNDLFAVLRSACCDPRLSVLTTRQLAMLIACDRIDWLMHTLAEHLNVSVSVVSRGADALVEHGLIHRWKQAGDKRRVWLAVTPNGSAALNALYNSGAEPTMGDLHKMVAKQ